MEGIVLLAVQIGVVIVSFIGVSAAINWYHGGGKSNDKSGHKMSGKNL